MITKEEIEQESDKVFSLDDGISIGRTLRKRKRLRKAETEIPILTIPVLGVNYRLQNDRK